jgi:hypothetical protein
MRNFRSNPAQRRDHYQELTEKIVAALEAGIAPWRRPWDLNACGGRDHQLSPNCDIGTPLDISCCLSEESIGQIWETEFCRQRLADASSP